MAINYSDIYGSFLPKVYVKNVTVEDNKVTVIFSIKESIDINSKHVFDISSNNFLKEHLVISIEQFSQLKDKIYGNSFLQREERLINLRQDKPEIILDPFNNRELIFQTSFFIDSNEINNLYYVIKSSLVGLEAKFGVKSSFISDYAEKTTELVFNNGSLQDKLYSYRTLDNVLWPGEVVYTVKNGKDTYYTNETPARELSQQAIPNIRLKDLRKNKTSLLIPNIDFINKQLNKFYISSFNRQVLEDLENKKNIFGEYVSILDSDRTLNYLFSIDFKNLIKQNSIYKNIVNDNNLEIIISFTNIIRCNLYRKQIKNKNSVKNIINTEEIDKLVSSEFKETQVFNSAFNKTYLISDVESPSILEGEYQYSVQIEFTDGVVLYLKYLLDNLLSVKNNLLNYYSVSQNPKYYSFQTDSFSSQEMQNYYDKFNIPEVIKSYLYAISSLNNYDQVTISSLNLEIQKYLFPQAASPTSINVFIESYNKLISILSKLISTTPQSGEISSFRLGTESNRILLNKIFNEKINLTIKNKSVLEYFKTSNASISLNSFRQQIEKEKALFQLSNTTLYPEEINYTYITPFALIVNNKINDIKIDNSFISDVKSTEIMTQARLANKNKQILNINLASPSSLEDFEAIKINNFLNISDFLVDKGIIIENNLIPSQEATDESSLVERDSYMRSQKETYDSIGDFTQILNSSKSQDFSFDIDSNVPNQMKYSKTIKDINYEQDINILKYRLITKIEVLDSIESNISSWNWKQLTYTKLNEKLNSGVSNLLIRLNNHDYKYNDSFVYKNINFEFNKYFIIKIR